MSKPTMLISKNAAKIALNASNMDVTQQAIGRRVAMKRVGKNLTQDQLAKISGLSRHKISNIENGTGGLVADVFKIAKALNSSPQYILVGNPININPTSK